MNSIVRIMTAVNTVAPGDPARCADSVEEIFSRLYKQPADIVVLPKLALSSPSCGNLFHNAALLEAAAQALDRVRLASRDLDCYVLAGLPLQDDAAVVSAIAVLYRGEVVGYLPTLDNPAPLDRGAYSDKILPIGSIFACHALRFAVLSCDPALLPVQMAALQPGSFDLVICPAYSPVQAGSTSAVLEGVSCTSRVLGCAIAVVNGGNGDTSFPHLYKPMCAVYECGEQLGLTFPDNEEPLWCDIDVDIIRAQKRFSSFQPAVFSAAPGATKRGLLRPVRRNPYLPADAQQEDAWLDEVYDFQVRALAARMHNTGIGRLVLGVSGGLDSTLALLVSAGALDRLGLPREQLTAVTMPGFGTSDRTYFNALHLIEQLGCTSRDISIGPSILQHFEDIGHDPAQRDTTYENAQARERTQILLDLANQQGALVVGTGDLSEEALGFATFGGDHLANYNVNVCVTKTIIRRLVGRLCEHEAFAKAAEVLRDIVETPVSPELLPAGEDGQISQKTEEILGPYELHDFFLYYFVRYGLRPGKLYYYACIAFADSYDPGFIREKLALFIRRFVSAQFKRSCAPDAAALAPVNLLGCSFAMPSDCSAQALLRDLENTEFNRR